MVVSVTTIANHYAGAGTTGPFAYGFKIYQDNDLVVIKKNTGGVEVPMVLTTDYTVVGAGLEAGGSITTVANVDAGETISILYKPAVKQESAFREQRDFSGARHENAYDKNLKQTQVLTRQMLGVPHLRETDNDGSFNTELPAPVASTIMGWDLAGTALRTYTASEIAALPSSTVVIDRKGYASDVLAGTAFRDALIDTAVVNIELLEGDYEITLTTTVSAPKVVRGRGAKHTPSNEGSHIFLNAAGIQVVCNGDQSWSDVVFDGNSIAGSAGNPMVKVNNRSRNFFYNCQFLDSAGEGVGGDSAAVGPLPVTSWVLQPMSMVGCAAISNGSHGFAKLTNLVNCYARQNGDAEYFECVALSGCIAHNSVADAVYGDYQDCNSLVNCQSIDSSKIFGFKDCARVANCIVTGHQYSVPANSSAFDACLQLSGCDAVTCDGWAFKDCERMNALRAQTCGGGYNTCEGIADALALNISGLAGSAYGFIDCNRVTSSRAESCDNDGFFRSDFLSGCQSILNTQNGYNDCEDIAACFAFTNTLHGFSACLRIASGESKINTLNGYQNCQDLSGVEADGNGVGINGCKRVANANSINNATYGYAAVCDRVSNSQGSGNGTALTDGSNTAVDATTAAGI